MTQPWIRIIPTATTMTQLEKIVKIGGSNIWTKTIKIRNRDIISDIGKMLVDKFNNTAIAKSLRGYGVEDLQAHLGLSDSVANSLVDGMANLIASSVQLIVKRNNGISSIRIQAVKDDWNEYLDLPGAKYISYPSNIVIPVAKWLLIDPSIDIGQAAYEIVFKGEDDKFDMRIRNTSRSGRAIMVSLSSLGGVGGYVLPDIISGQAGMNFIEYTLRQKNIAIEAATLLMKRVM